MNTHLDGVSRIVALVVLLIAIFSFIVPMNIGHLDTILIALLAFAFLVV